MVKAKTYTKEEEALYRQIAKRLTDRRRLPESKYLPRIYKMLATPDQVRVLLELPAPVEELAHKLDLDKKFVEDTIQDQFEKGVIVNNKEGQWFLPRAIWQFHDATLPTRKYEKEEWWKDYCDLWGEFYATELDDSEANWAKQIKRQTLRVVAYPQALEGVSGVEPPDDIRWILTQFEPISVEPCACRRKERQRPCQTPEDVCLNIGRTALYNINRGSARKITLEEALEIHSNISIPNDLVLTMNNLKVVHNLICTCHVCTCCDFYRVYAKYGLPVMNHVAPSRFRPTVDLEKCQGCQTCIDTCPFGAIKMIQYPGEKHPRHPLGNPQWKARVDAELCMGCGLCVIKCPHGAKGLEVVRPLEHIPDQMPPAQMVA